MQGIGFGVGDLYRLHGAQQLPQEAGNGAVGLAAGVVVAQKALPGEAVEEGNAQQGQGSHQGDGRVDAPHDDKGDQGEQQVAGQFWQPGGEIGEVGGIIVQAGDGVAGGHGLGQCPRPVQDVAHDVGAQQHAVGIAHAGPAPVAQQVGGQAGGFDGQQQGQQGPQAGGGRRSPGEPVQELLQQQSRQQAHGQEVDPAGEVGQEVTRPEANERPGGPGDG